MSFCSHIESKSPNICRNEKMFRANVLWKWNTESYQTHFHVRPTIFEALKNRSDENLQNCYSMSTLYSVFIFKNPSSWTYACCWKSKCNYFEIQTGGGTCFRSIMLLHTSKWYLVCNMYLSIGSCRKRRSWYFSYCPPYLAKRLINFGDCIFLRLQVEKEEEVPVMAYHFEGAFFSQSVWW